MLLLRTTRGGAEVCMVSGSRALGESNVDAGCMVQCSNGEGHMEEDGTGGGLEGRTLSRPTRHTPDGFRKGGLGRREARDSGGRLIHAAGPYVRAVYRSHRGSQPMGRSFTTESLCHDQGHQRRPEVQRKTRTTGESGRRPPRRASTARCSPGRGVHLAQ